jgi:hypothetical protein
MGLQFRRQTIEPGASRKLRFLAPLILFAGMVVPAFGVGENRLQTSLCPSLGWAEQERIPIFDPLASPDELASRERLGRLDEEIRSQVEEELRRKGWRIVAREEAACRMRYSLIQELDLEVARRGGGGLPGDPFGGTLPSTGTDSHVRRQGTFTLDVVVGDPEDRIWRGTRKDPLGQGREVDRNIRRQIREVLKEVPRAR